MDEEELLKREIYRVRMFLDVWASGLITDEEIAMVLKYHYPREAAQVLLKKLTGES